jgi:hypothetical protein
MAWTDGSDKSSGDVITAAIWNSYLGAGDGIDAMETAKVTTAGDIVYATGDNTLARLGVGSARQVLQMNSGASAPEYAASAQSTMTAKGDILAASGANTLARLAVGANDKVLTADSSEATGLKWGDAPGATAAAPNEGLALQMSGQLVTPTATSVTANRIYGAFLEPVRTAISMTEAVCAEIDTGGNYILSIYSTDGSTMTRRATTGSTSVPSSSDDLTKLSLSFTFVVGTRYLIAFSFSGTPDVRFQAADSNSVEWVGNSFRYDPGSFAHASTIAHSAVTFTKGDSVICMLNNGGIIT